MAAGFLQLHISDELHCNGFLVAVHDGVFWGYEFSSSGVMRDRSVQNPEHLDWSIDWFPGESCVGNADILANHFPGLERDALKRYLVRYPAWEEWRHEKDPKLTYNRLIEERNVRARPEDECLPFDECAVLDFLRYLGIDTGLRDGWVTFAAPVWRSFWVSGQNTRKAWKERRRRLRQP